MIKKKELLICGAFDGEVDLLRKDKSLNVLISGVGALNSIFYIYEYLRRNPEIKSILFCGSCGLYPGSIHAPGEIVYSDHFFYEEIASHRGIVKVPNLIKKEIQTNTPEYLRHILTAQRIKSGKTNSTNSITITELDVIERNYFASKNVSFENMESFGIAFLTEKHSIPFTALFSITNLVGKNGSIDWQKNWRKCSDRLQTLLLEILG